MYYAQAAWTHSLAVILAARPNSFSAAIAQAPNQDEYKFDALKLEYEMQVARRGPYPDWWLMYLFKSANVHQSL